MVATWKQYEGQAVDGIPLVRLLGGSDASAVFLGELAGQQCAIKLVPAEEAAGQALLTRWQQASKLSHPHLTRIHQWGRAKLGGRSMVYLAMEFAEEDLASVDRPLTPKETREMLAPAVQALAYLHGQKFAHGRFRPANVLSVNDVLKISGDAPLKVGERSAPPSSAYDPPDLEASGVTPAGDVWSLGATLVEALTKQLPKVEADSIRLPDTLKPDSFREVAAGCLNLDPARRWTIPEIAEWLERGTVPMPKRRKPRYLVPVTAAAVLVLAMVLAWPYFTGSRTQPSAATAVTAPQESAPAQPVVNAKDPAPEPAPPQPAKTSIPPKPPEAKKSPKASEPKPSTPEPKSEPLVARATAPAATAPQQELPQQKPAVAPAAPAEVVSPDVTHSVLPEVPAKARATIHGKVPIVVRIEADSSGAVTGTTVESGGSSKYFANLAVKAAQQWKFVPGEGARSWTVRFEFTAKSERGVMAQLMSLH